MRNLINSIIISRLNTVEPTTIQYDGIPPSTPDWQKANQFKFQELRRFLHIFLQLRNWIMEQTRMWWRFSKPGFLHHQSSNNDGGFTHFPPTYQLNHGTSTWKSWLWKYEKNFFSLRKSGQSTPIRTSMVLSRKTKQPRKRFHQLAKVRWFLQRIVLFHLAANQSNSTWGVINHWSCNIIVTTARPQKSKQSFTTNNNLEITTTSKTTTKRIGGTNQPDSSRGHVIGNPSWLLRWAISNSGSSSCQTQTS